MNHPHNRLALSAPGQSVPPARRPYLVVNPRSRLASSAIAEVVRQCRLAGVPPPVSLATTRLQPGSTQTRQAIEAGADLVIVVGGDGTIRQAARELAGGQTRMGVIALGSGNVLAHNLGLAGRSLTEQIEVALGEHCAGLDVGWARLVRVQGQIIREPFCTMVGIGRDAQTVAATGFDAKRRLGWGAYALSGVQHALARPLPMRVQLDDQPWHSVVTWTVLAGITPRAPGGVLVYPDAVGDDGVLSVLEVPIRHPGQWLPVALKGLAAPGLPTSALRYHRAMRLTVRPAEALPVQLDGDVVTEVTELTATVQQQGLRVQIAQPRSGS